MQLLQCAERVIGQQQLAVAAQFKRVDVGSRPGQQQRRGTMFEQAWHCLLYTSDAADE